MSTAEAVNEPELLKCRKSTDAKKLAASLEIELERHGRADLQAMGAGATLQATKALIFVRGLLAQKGRDISVVPCFVKAETQDGDNRTAVRMTVTLRTVN